MSKPFVFEVLAVKASKEVTLSLSWLMGVTVSDLRMIEGCINLEEVFSMP